MDEARKVLKRVFGHSSFKSAIQEEAIRAALQGDKDIFVAMPTGAGKSLCYQLPAVINGGVTLVISPLIALMKDQMDHLKDLGIRAATINSKQPQQERDEVCTDLASAVPSTRLLYVTPEQVATSRFREIAAALVANGVLRCLVVDEAHCVSEWGHDFRPDYARLGSFRAHLDRAAAGSGRGTRSGAATVPCMALTATASQHVANDVCSILQLRQPVVSLRTSSFRSNLYYDVKVKELLEDPYADLARFAADSLGLDESKPAPKDWTSVGCGIVYCRTRESCTELAHRLSRRGMPTRPYHAGLPAEARNRAQTDWMDGKLAAVAATISFGMGIDKADVRFVAHWTIPKSVAGYYQESGRAGRDGRPSYCRLYYSREEKNTVAFLIQQENQKRQDSSKKKKKSSTEDGAGGDKAARASRVSEKNFETMVNYCEQPKCRHELLCAYFGDSKPHCRQACDYCSNPKEVDDQLKQLHMCAFSTSYSRDKGRRATMYSTTAEMPASSHDLYGGGRHGLKRERDELDDEQAEPAWYRQQKIEQEERKERRSMIEREFAKRRKASASEAARRRREDDGSEDGECGNCPLQAREATATKVLNLTVKTRERCYEMIRSALAANKAALQQHEPEAGRPTAALADPEGLGTLGDSQVTAATASLEYDCFTKCTAVDSYRMAVVRCVTDVKKATKLDRLHSSLSVSSPTAKDGPCGHASPDDPPSAAKATTPAGGTLGSCGSGPKSELNTQLATCLSAQPATESDAVTLATGISGRKMAGPFVTASTYLKERGDSQLLGTCRAAVPEPKLPTAADAFAPAPTRPAAPASSISVDDDDADAGAAAVLRPALPMQVGEQGFKPAAAAGRHVDSRLCVDGARGRSGGKPRTDAKQQRRRVQFDSEKAETSRSTHGRCAGSEAKARHKVTTLTDLWRKQHAPEANAAAAGVSADAATSDDCSAGRSPDRDQLTIDDDEGHAAATVAPVDAGLAATTSAAGATSSHRARKVSARPITHTTSEQRGSALLNEMSALVVRYLMPYYNQKKFASKDLFKMVAKALSQHAVRKFQPKDSLHASLGNGEGAAASVASAAKDLVKTKIKAIFSSKPTIANEDDVADVVRSLLDP